MNQITGTFPLSLCEVKTCYSNSPFNVAPCGSTDCCDLGDGAACPTPAPTAGGREAEDEGDDACRDLWSAAGLPPTVEAQGGKWQQIFTANDLANLEGEKDEKVSMSFEATSTCSKNIELGFSGGGGWLKVTVRPGAHTYVVEDTRKKGSGTAYEIRTPGCGGTITLDLITYCAASDDSSNDDGNGSSQGASLAIIIPVVVAAVLLVAAVLYLIRKRRVAAATPDEAPELHKEVPIEA